MVSTVTVRNISSLQQMNVAEQKTVLMWIGHVWHLSDPLNGIRITTSIVPTYQISVSLL